MSPNCRIFLNFATTYGRSMYATVCGIFTARWVLMALGEQDYGLIGVVGGVIGFIGFFNSLMAASVSRFYAYSIGRVSVANHNEITLNEIRKWFNVAVTLHLSIAVFSIGIGYPVGEWAIKNFLTIPATRITESIWVFRISCLSCFISMASVPCKAMYTAKQEIAELTIYDFASTTMNFLFIFYMVSHQGNWFVPYVGWTAFLIILPLMIISVRAFFKYKECRIVLSYLFLRHEMKELLRYAGLRSISTIAAMLTFNGTPILVNKMLGPTHNAAAAISNSVSGHVLSLTSALNVALGPAITNAVGAKDYRRMQTLSYGADMFSALSIAVFAVPLVAEMDIVLRLWLKNVPQGAGTLCQLMLIAKIINQTTMGEYLSLIAHRNIAALQIFDFILYLIPFSTAAIVFSFGGDIWGIGLGFIIMYSVANIVRLYFAKRLYQLKLHRWFLRLLLPLLAVVCVSFLIALGISHIMREGFFRVVCTAVLSDMFLVLMAWKFLLTQEIKSRVTVTIYNKLGNLIGFIQSSQS